MTNFTDLDKNDLHELFRIYDFAKVNKVDDVVEHAEKMEQSPEMLFDALYEQYEIEKLPNREELIQQMHETEPNASQAQILSVIRITEMKKFSASDALRALQRQISHVNNTTTSTIDKSKNEETINNVNQLASGPSHPLPLSSLEHEQTGKKCVGNSFNAIPETQCVEKERTHGDDCKLFCNYNSSGNTIDNKKTSTMDEIVVRDVQDWIATIIGDKFNKYVSPSDSSTTAFINTLRDGVVLHILLQKLHCPPMSDDEIVIPKRTKGFFARDNVSVFLEQVHERYQLHEAELFTNSDLCDGKNDRQVITCLLALARAAYAHGDTTFLPRLISFEKEINANKCTVTAEELDAIVAEAEVDVEKELPAQLTEEISTQDQRSEQEKQESKESDVVATEVNAQDITEHNTELLEWQEETKEAQQEVTQENKVEVERPLTLEKEENSKQEENVSQSQIAVKDSADASTTEQKEELQYNESSTVLLEGEGNGADKCNLRAMEKQEQVGVSESKVAPELVTTTTKSTTATAASQGTNRVFYVRGNHIIRETTLENNVNGSIVDNGKQHNTCKSSLKSIMRHPYSVEKPCPAHLLYTKEVNVTEDVLAPRYHARHWDGIDCLLGEILNAHYARFPHSPWRFRALFSQPGEYVVYNRRSADKHVVHLRAIHNRLLIHQPQPVANKTRFVYHWVELTEALEQMENA